ncbi:MAG: cytochrome c class [Sphingomonas bacterium]|uniref:c-type cytochrome n=1 Tax=Sphingomonas bacterium TaxID=1895847 RepID=UPI00261BC953|nr:c-type cytochrome [Sphingomonas bacterium]MDB5710337.1 cytochrome c class [Sphingomonas bacterium]
MPYSLRFVLGLMVGAALFAAGAGLVEHKQETRESRTSAEQLTGGDSVRGKAAIMHYGCGGCHEIQGIGSARGGVGPSLSGIAVRTELAGHLPNDPANMVRWLRDPQGVAPGNGMPNLGVSEQDGRDMAAYLYTLKPMLPPS